MAGHHVVTNRRSDPRMYCVFDGKHCDDHTPDELAKCINDALTLWPSMLQRMGTPPTEGASQ
jgi:hypothetical protein